MRLKSGEVFRFPDTIADNSAGIIGFPQWRQDLVRAGIALVRDCIRQRRWKRMTVQLKPALRLVSHVSFVKEVAPGASISYGGTFTAEKKLKVATIPVGYGDGYARGLIQSRQKS